jgi:hypothetical protein
MPRHGEKFEMESAVKRKTYSDLLTIILALCGITTPSTTTASVRLIGYLAECGEGDKRGEVRSEPS